MANRVLLSALVVASLCLTGVLSISCYSCNSASRNTADSPDNCMDSDTFDSSKLRIVDNCTYCLKYIQDVEKEKRMMRGCADELETPLVEKNKDEGCVFTTGTRNVQLQICNCKGKLCNGVVPTTASAAFVVVSSALVVLTRYL